MPQGAATTHEQGKASPASKQRPAGSTYFHITTGINYTQVDVPLGNSWVPTDKCCEVNNPMCFDADTTSEIGMNVEHQSSPVITMERSYILTIEGDILVADTTTGEVRIYDKTMTLHTTFEIPKAAKMAYNPNLGYIYVGTDTDSGLGDENTYVITRLAEGDYDIIINAVPENVNRKFVAYSAFSDSVLAADKFTGLIKEYDNDYTNPSYFNGVAP